MNPQQDKVYRARWAAVAEDESRKTEGLAWTDRRFLWVVRAIGRWVGKRELVRWLEQTTPQVGWNLGRVHEFTGRLADRGLLMHDHRGRLYARGTASYGLQERGVWTTEVEGE